MKITQLFSIFSICLLTSCTNAPGNLSPASATSSTSAQHSAAERLASIPKFSGKLKGRVMAKIPENFMDYASETVGEGNICVVGAATDEDGLNQKPVVYTAAGKSKLPLWLDQLELPANSFQSHATHCNQSDGALFVLLQADTQPEQTLSQTLLQVIKINPATGEILIRRDVAVPSAYTAWVEEGASHFHWVDGTLLISGNYRTQSNDGPQKSFTVRLNDHLEVASEDTL